MNRIIFYSGVLMIVLGIVNLCAEIMTVSSCGAVTPPYWNIGTGSIIGVSILLIIFGIVNLYIGFKK